MSPDQCVGKLEIPCPVPRGFTLVELLVVITIIGILIALLLPAIQAAREAARKSQCTNNLKQLALGAMMHESTHGWFPTNGWGGGYTGDPDLGFDSKQPGGWIYNLLPYIEQQAFHDQAMGQAAAEKKATLATAIGTPVTAVFCPSRRSPAAIAFAYPSLTSYWKNVNFPSLVAHNDYAINGGGTAQQNPGNWDANAEHNGISYYKSTVRMSDIKDGTSNTYLLGEKYMNADKYNTGTDTGDDGIGLGGHDPDNCRWTNASIGGPRQDTPAVAASAAFGSAHANGFNMAFCDGSVNQISYNIDLMAHQYLGDRDDEQPVDQSKL